MWDVILNAIAKLTQFYTTHQVTIDNLFSGGGVVAVTAFIFWVKRLHPPPFDPSSRLPFELVKPNRDVFSLVYPPVSDYKNPVLADRNIPYQRRIQGRNITQELCQHLHEHRWVLIMGRTGIGKTREAAEVAQQLNHEGWTILKLALGEWLDRPNAEQLQAIGTDRKLLFLLDDLHQFMRRSEAIEKHPQGKDNLAMPMNIPLQERLLDTLTAYENDVADPQEIRVLAITRNEKEVYRAGQDSPLDKLQWDKYQNLWRKFHVYNMPDPEDSAIVELFQEVIPKTKIKQEANYIDLAVSNDGTFRNVVENLVSLDNQNLALTKQTFKPTLQGTWHQHYQTAIQRDKLAEAIYDAVDLLQQCYVPLNEFLVKKTALLMVEGNRLQRLWCQFRLKESLNKLIAIERILTPRDGQIKERGKRVEITDYSKQLEKLILKLFKAEPQLMTEALKNFSLFLYQVNLYPRALIGYQHLVTAVKEDAEIWFYLATTYYYLEKYAEAIQSYNKALKIKPDYHEAWYNKGIALGNLVQLDEAIQSYNKALKIKPDYHEAWYNKGVALGNLGQLHEAIQSYNIALEIKPDYHEAWYNKGVALGNLVQLDEAIQSYNKALEIKPDDHQAWYNKGVALMSSKQYQEALNSYQKALEINPNDAIVYYNIACYYALQNNVSLAVENLHRAINLDETCREMAKTNSDFDSIRDEQLFKQIINH